jgi:soluble cytochrome b562
MDETLIETFKRYYADYRGAATVDQSFTDAYQAIAYYVIDQTEQFAQRGNLEEIQNMIREFKEIGLSVGPSNDALKERFEQELVEQVLDR